LSEDCQVGDLFVFKDASHNVLQSSTLKAAGHNLFGVYGSFNILRDLVLSNNWNDKRGYRAGELMLNTRKVKDAEGHNTLEDSYVINGGQPPAGPKGDTTVKNEGVGQIIRDVVLAKNASSAAISSAIRAPIVPVSKNGRVYNITVLGHEKMWDQRSKSISGYRFLNVAGDAKVGHKMTGDNTLAASKFLADLKLDKNYCPQARSVLIDAGTTPTRTRSSGQGTIIPVEDAGYFTDGEGIRENYQIQVGKQVAEIQRVNYKNNTIEVLTSLKWAKGDGVSQPYAGKAPDVGACEYRQ
jgi:hypothetical protein